MTDYYLQRAMPAQRNPLDPLVTFNACLLTLNGDSSVETISTCCGTREKKGVRCINPIGDEHRYIIKFLLAKYRDLGPCQHDRNFFIDVKEYLRNAYCRYHQYQSVENFKAWKRQEEALVAADPPALRKIEPLEHFDQDLGESNASDLPFPTNLQTDSLYSKSTARLDITADKKPPAVVQVVETASGVSPSGDREVFISVQENITAGAEVVTQSVLIAEVKPEPPLRDEVHDITEPASPESWGNSSPGTEDNSNLVWNASSPVQSGVKLEDDYTDLTIPSPSTPDPVPKNHAKGDDTPESSRMAGLDGDGQGTLPKAGAEPKPPPETPITFPQRTTSFDTAKARFPEKPSPTNLFQKIHQGLMHWDKLEGIVYVLAHNTEKRYLKVGWTQKTAENRVKVQDCYANTTPIFCSELHFKGAFHVEQLVHAELWAQNITINCQHCRRTHIEWFEVSKERLEASIRGWTDFVKFPAHNDSGKLTRVARLAIDAHQMAMTRNLASTMSRIVAAQKDGSVSSFSHSIEVDVDLSALSLTTPNNTNGWTGADQEESPTKIYSTPRAYDDDEGASEGEQSLAPTPTKSRPGPRTIRAAMKASSSAGKDVPRGEPITVLAPSSAKGRSEPDSIKSPPSENGYGSEGEQSLVPRPMKSGIASKAKRTIAEAGRKSGAKIFGGIDFLKHRDRAPQAEEARKISVAPGRPDSRHAPRRRQTAL